jgi:hypothetical protein
MSSKAWLGRVTLALVVMVALAFSGTAFGQAPAPAPKPPQAAEKKDAAKPEEAKKPEPPKPGEDKPFDEVVKDMEVIKGVFTFYKKADENKILLEILPDQMDKLFLFAGSVDSSIGERGFYAAQMGGDFPFYFQRVGKSIHWMMKNTNFSASNGPAQRTIARSFPDSLMGAAKIQSKPHPERKSILVDAAELFVSDLPGFGPALTQVYQPTAYRFDKANSAISTVKAFQENVMLDVWLHYVTDNPRTPSVTLPDQRSVPILVKYELSALKDTGFKPRVADDRVGQFLTIMQDFTSDMPSTPYLRYIDRWQLEKADPTAKLSPPKQPIVFWLENTIPVEYREWVKEGVLLWNRAFERIGFKDAVVVKQQPDNADWDPADTRYSTIRWFAGVDATFAIGPSRANPFTGQIYDADIGLSEGIFRLTRRSAQEFNVPSVPTSMEDLPPVSPWFRNQRYQCFYGEGMAQQAEFAVMALDARGELTPEVEQKLMHEYMVETVAHEVGHTLGLRHNFRASNLLKLNELNDVAKTDEMGQTASVMDYNPIVIAAKGQKQGHFLTPTLGPYDLWAIEYAYKPIEGNEKAELAKIASRVADPTVPYATDEDVLGTTSPQAMDPSVNQFDQSSDPIAYYRERFGIVNELWGAMDSKLVKPGEGYQVLRRTVNRGLSEYVRGLLVTTKFIGGVYFNRDHAGDPNQRPPYVPVPAAKQREALDVLRTYAFSEKAFQLPQGELNRLAIDRLPGLDFFAYFFGAQRIDYPWHDQVLTVQRLVLTRLYHPLVLGRVLDNELRFAPNEKSFTMADLFKGLDSAIWTELDAPAVKISSIRRNLQREQLKQLTRLVLRPPPAQAGPSPVGFVLPVPPTPRPPEDATTLARASLVSLQAKIKAALAAGKVSDPTTKAHLEETQARAAAALQAQMSKPLE